MWGRRLSLCKLNAANGSVHILFRQLFEQFKIMQTVMYPWPITSMTLVVNQLDITVHEM